MEEYVVRLGYASQEAEFMVRTMSEPEINKQIEIAQKSLALIKLENS